MNVEELEIIIRAKVEDALTGIQSVVDGVKNAVKDSTTPIKQITTETKKVATATKSSVQQATSEFSKYKKEIEQTEKTVRKIAVNLSGIKFDFNLGEPGDIEKQYSKAYDEYLKTQQNNTPTVNEPQSNSMVVPTVQNQTLNIDTSSIKQASNDVYTLEQRLQDFDMLTIREEIKTIGMQISATFPQIQKFGNDLKQSVLDANNVFGQLSQRIKEFGTGFAYIPTVASQAFSNMKNTISKNVEDAVSSIQSKFSPISSIFNSIAQLGKNAFAQASANISSFGKNLTKQTSKFKSFLSNFDFLKKKVKDVSNSTKSLDFGKTFTKGISSIKKFALSLLSVSTAFSVVSRAAQSYLSFDTQLSDSIQNSWNVLGSLLAPALEMIASLFAKCTSYVAAFVKTLTGIDLVAKANSKALDKQSKSAQNVSHSLSNLDEINNIGGSSSGGSGDTTTTITTEPVDSSVFDPLFSKIEEIKQVLTTIFEPIKASWDQYGTALITSIQNAFTSIGELSASVFSSFMEVWTNGTGEEIVSNFLVLWTTFFDLVSAVANAINTAWQNGNNGTAIFQGISNIFKDIQKFVISIGDTLTKWVLSEDFQTMLNGVFGVIKDLVGYVEDFADWILKMYDTYLKPVIEEQVLPAITSIIQALLDIWNGAVKPVVDWVVDIIGTTLEPVIQGLCDFIGGIVTVVKGIANFISGVFTGDWKKAWNGIKDIFSGIWNSISAIIKTPINTILSSVEFCVNKLIEGFNFVKQSLNKLSFDIPDWVPIVGGQKWGFNLQMSEPVTLPRLNTGTGYVPEDMTAVLHKGEAVIPKKFNDKEYFGSNDNEETNDLLRQLIDLIDSKNLNFSISRDEIGQSSVDFINEKKRLTGRSPV